MRRGYVWLLIANQWHKVTPMDPPTASNTAPFAYSLAPEQVYGSQSASVVARFYRTLHEGPKVRPRRGHIGSTAGGDDGR